MIEQDKETPKDRHARERLDDFGPSYHQEFSNENHFNDSDKDYCSKLKEVCKVHFMRSVCSAPQYHNTSQKTSNSITIFLFSHDKHNNSIISFQFFFSSLTAFQRSPSAYNLYFSECACPNPFISRWQHDTLAQASPQI